MFQENINNFIHTLYANEFADHEISSQRRHLINNRLLI